MSLTRGLVLDVANQLGGTMPSIVTLHDYSRHGNDGAMANVIWTQTAAGLWVMNFNGTTATVNCGNDASVDIGLGLTIEAWVNFDNLFDITRGDWDTTISHISYYAGFNPGTGRLMLALAGIANFEGIKDSWAALTWFHIVCTHDGALTNHYVNGALDRSQAGVGSITQNPANNLHIGSYDPTWDWFEGRIAMPRVRNYALTAAQVRARYHSTKWLFGVAS